MPRVAGWVGGARHVVVVVAVAAAVDLAIGGAGQPRSIAGVDVPAFITAASGHDRRGRRDVIRIGVVM